MKAKWHFRKKQPGEITRDPVVGEFFSTDAIDNPAEALVREGIQNALDARLESESQVRVRIFISQGNKSISENWIGNAWLHFKAKGNGLQKNPLETESCSYLVFEDFGTTGLYGDETQDVDSGRKNPFFYFFRAEGRSDKAGEDRGRWGVGKHVFPRSSRINTYFGMTLRSTDKKKMLMGHTILKYHEVAKTFFTPDGYLGIQQDNQMILPFIDGQTIEEFSKDFNLSRKSESGLSIVVPHIDPEINLERIKHAVITGYFLPVLENKLIITIENEEQMVEINQSSIAQEAIGLTDDKGNDFSPTLKFANWCVTESQENLYMLNPCSDVPPAWSDMLIPKHLKRTMREDLDLGKNMAVRLPLKVETEEGLVNSHFYCYLGPDNNKTTRPVFIREGITISNVRRATRMSGIRALVIVNHKPLASLLGDSENPAHTEWQKGSKTFTSKHLNGRSYIDFVSNSVSRLVNALSAEEGEKDPYLLSDIFSLPLSGDGRNTQPDAKNAIDKDKKPVSKKPEPKDHHKPLLFTISKTKNGFKITPNAIFDDLPFTFKILTAYNVRKGNPFKKYNNVDFQIKDSMITSKGLQVVKVEGNEILLKATLPDFEIEVKGFDNKRDLIVKADKIEGGEDD
jgi:hypothetical protein